MSDDLTHEQRIDRAAHWIREIHEGQQAATRRLDHELVTHGFTLHIDALTTANPADDLDAAGIADANAGLLACYRYSIHDGESILAETFAWTAARPAPGDHPSITASGADMPPECVADLLADLRL